MLLLLPMYGKRSGLGLHNEFLNGGVLLYYAFWMAVTVAGGKTHLSVALLGLVLNEDQQDTGQ